MPRSLPHRSYKQIQVQQLRSFCATAQLGSLTAAAQSLGLTQPTVCEQVHALERTFAVRLIERRAHGCRLTEAGRLVAELAAPLVAGIDSLPRSVQEALGRVASRLTVAATPRILVEDLPAAIVEFERVNAAVELCLVELGNDAILSAVESGNADIGLTASREPESPSPWLEFEPAYELDTILVTPLDHPLARRRQVRPKDLAGYPLVNSRNGFPDAALVATLDKLGAFRTRPRRVEVAYTAAIRRYVELGFGIGLIIGLPSRPAASGLHEQCVSRHFGRVPVNLVWRKGALRQGPARLFAQTIKTSMDGRGRQ